MPCRCTCRALCAHLPCDCRIAHCRPKATWSPFLALSRQRTGAFKHHAWRQLPDCLSNLPYKFGMQHPFLRCITTNTRSHIIAAGPEHSSTEPPDDSGAVSSDWRQFRCESLVVTTAKLWDSLLHSKKRGHRLPSRALNLLAAESKLACRARLVATDRGEQSSSQVQTHWAHNVAKPEKGCLLLAHPLMFSNSQSYFSQVPPACCQHRVAHELNHMSAWIPLARAASEADSESRAATFRQHRRQ